MSAITDFLEVLRDSVILYSVAKPRAEIGKTKYKDRYEAELIKASKDFEREQHNIIKSKKNIYGKLNSLYDKFIDRFTDIQQKYMSRVGDIDKQKKQRYRKKLKAEV